MRFLIFIPLLFGCSELSNFLGASISNSPVESIEDHRERYNEKRGYQEYYKQKNESKCDKKNDPGCSKKN